MTERVGLVLARATRVLGAEPYYHEFIEGLEHVFTPAGISVLVKVVTDRNAENATYRRWCARRLVDAVLMVDLSPGDDRIALVRELGLPTVVMGDPSTSGGLPTVWTDDHGFAREVVGFLAGRGHVVLGHVSGPATFAHSQLRRAGFEAETARRGITLIGTEGDYSREHGRAVTARLLASRPTAIVYDNDLMALGGLEAIEEHGLRVPEDVSVVAWDDSAQCQLAVPALSAMSHDVCRVGEIAAHAVLDMLGGGARGEVYQAPRARVVERESTR